MSSAAAVVASPATGTSAGFFFGAVFVAAAAAVFGIGGRAVVAFVFVIVCSVIVILGITCGGIRGGRGNGFRFRFRLAALFNLVIADVFN